MGLVEHVVDCETEPALKGSGIVFVSGGSAPNNLAAAVARSGFSATHVLAVFDNGGSTGRLRNACGGIAVGDIRNRLLVLSARNTDAATKLALLASHRLAGNKSQQVLRKTIEDIAQGSSDLLLGISSDAVTQLRTALSRLLDTLPRDFDWREAVVGNLMLEGRYVESTNWRSVLDWAHRLLAAQGLVLPVTTDSAHIGARLENDRYILGQSAITDEVERIEAPIKELRLHPSDRFMGRIAHARLYPGAKEQLETAKVIVYTWGSFYTSVLCSFLVDGFAATIGHNSARKVLLLNPFRDAETLGKTSPRLVQELNNFGKPFGAARMVTDVIALRAKSPVKSLYTPAERQELERLGADVTEIQCEGLPQAHDLSSIIVKLVELAASV